MIQKNINGGDSQKIQESSENHMVRVNCNFYNWSEYINEKRKKKGLKAFSMNVFTNLLIKHNSRSTVEEDLINFDLKDKNGK